MKIVVASLAVLFLAGCTTTNVTDPTDDSLLTSIKCTFNNSCQNHNEEKREELEAETATTADLSKQKKQASAEFDESEAKLVKLRNEVTTLDKTIAKLQAEAGAAQAKKATVDPQLEEALAQLDELRAKSRDLEFGVLKETVDVSEMEAKKVELEQWRDELEQVLNASM